VYRVVRRWAGPVPGLLAAGIFGATPIAASMFGHSMEDGALTMCLVFAANSWQRAVMEARLRSLIWAGVWVGLRFQAKMLQTWMILPALGIGYLLAAPAGLRRRLWHLGVAGLVMLAVSLSWIALYTFTPAADRPYMDGSTDNSAIAMVFGLPGPAAGRAVRRGDGAVLAVVPVREPGRLLLPAAVALELAWAYYLWSGYRSLLPWALPIAIAAGASAIAVMVAAQLSRRYASRWSALGSRRGRAHVRARDRHGRRGRWALRPAAAGRGAASRSPRAARFPGLLSAQRRRTGQYPWAHADRGSRRGDRGSGRAAGLTPPVLETNEVTLDA
jgi:4-amino-4-deoxy-L-arabinose transferase-like glycosyltransferase